jgi:hypothetical protein
MPGFPLEAEDIASYAKKSPELGAILISTELKRIADDYVQEDVRAIEAQGRFSKVAAHLNAAVLATAVVGSLILALGLLLPWFQLKEWKWLVDASPWALRLLGLVGLLVGGYSAARLYELNAGDLAGLWMKSRARAEKLRSDYFDRLAARAVKEGAAARTAAINLVCLHLLDHQLDYFTKRGLRHEKAAGRWLGWAAFATGVASVGVAAGGMAGTANQPWILVVAALGTIGGAAAAFATSQATIGQEKERGQRFRNNRAALSELARKIDDVTTAVAGESPEALVTFTNGINQQLALELGQFLDGGESIRASITKLGEEIEKAAKKNDKPGGG